MSFSSGIYTGSVTHVRTRPKKHRLSYRVFWFLLDLDELETLSKSLRFFSLGRFNLFSFSQSDHATASNVPLRRQIETVLTDAGLDLPGGAIRLLCMPRVFGYVFNPISVYFCHRKTGELAAIIYEVTNTFGQRHSYLIPVDRDEARQRQSIKQSARKELYVSPFIDMNITYDFRVMEPDETVSLTVRGSDPEGLLISASMIGMRSEFSDRALIRAALTHPLLTLKVVVGIHWEALKLWVKGVRLTHRPAPPSSPVTFVTSKAVSDVRT
ncbi:DUF1365 domain-containing protein [Terrihabitans soli]|uniref:DUF1365 domain-containing protein n=1 Tax=Terrihabitans soli TaxID=708113 RepID=A0A6S6QNC7_9HYPH|nr:DUF1365 family protein [Terrihabitans soli]BCJ90459.1 DUF1365 domain-containing protein [Terrihabitans soli]